MSATTFRWAIVAVFAGATGIGVAPILVRLSETGPSVTAAWRIAFALFPLWWLSQKSSQQEEQSNTPPTPPSSTGFAWAGVLFALDMASWHYSLQFTTVANSTFLANLAPLLVMLGARVFFKEPLFKAFIWGIGLAILGGSLLMGNSWRFSPENLFGDLLSLMTAFFYSGYLLMLRQLRRKGHSASVILFRSGLVSSPILLLIGWIGQETLWPTSLVGWLPLLGLAFISHVGGQFLIAYAMAHLRTAFSAISLFWQPVVAALLAWIFLDEPLNTQSLTGGFIILTGILVASSKAH